MDSGKFQAALGRAIRARRAKVGLSQEAFAGLAGIHRTYIGSVERGERNISLQNLLRIAIALGTSVSSLLVDAEKDRA
jgi:transcriptional regulator with XRE-family HTH domain